jgi:hypothetical protein
MRRSQTGTPAPQTTETERRGDAGSLPRSFEELGRRLGFSSAQLRLRYHDREQHGEFVRIFGDSILFAAERDPKFYQRGVWSEEWRG